MKRGVVRCGGLCCLKHYETFIAADLHIDKIYVTFGTLPNPDPFLQFWVSTLLHLGHCGCHTSFPAPQCPTCQGEPGKHECRALWKARRNSVSFLSCWVGKGRVFLAGGILCHEPWISILAETIHRQQWLRIFRAFLQMQQLIHGFSTWTCGDSDPTILSSKDWVPGGKTTNCWCHMWRASQRFTEGNEGQIVGAPRGVLQKSTEQEGKNWIEFGMFWGFRWIPQFLKPQIDNFKLTTSSKVAMMYPQLLSFPMNHHLGS